MIHATDYMYHCPSTRFFLLFVFFDRKEKPCQDTSVCKYECICVYTDVFNHTFLSREIKSHISEMISELRQQLSLVFMSDRCDIKGVCILSKAVNQVSCFCVSSPYLTCLTIFTSVRAAKYTSIVLNAPR